MKYAVLLIIVLAMLCGEVRGQTANEALVRRLVEQKVTLQAKNMPLAELLATVGESARFSWILDPAAEIDGKSAGETPITGNFNDQVVDDLLVWVLNRRGMDRMLIDGVVFVISSKKTMIPTLIYEPLPEATLAKLEKASVSCRGKGDSLRELVARTVKTAGFELRYDVRAEPPVKDVKIHCDIHDMPLDVWLDWAVGFERLTWRVEGNAVIITDGLSPEDARSLQAMRRKVLTCWLAEQPLGEVLKYLGEQGQVNVVLDIPDAQRAQKVTLTMNDVTAEEGISRAARAVKLHRGLWKGLVVLTDAKGARRLRNVEDHAIRAAAKPAPLDRQVKTKLEGTVVSFSFSEQPVAEAMEYLSTVGGVGLVMDGAILREPTQTLSLALTNVRLDTVLEVICWRMGWRCAIVKGRVFITDDEGLKRLEKEHGVRLVPMPREISESRKKLQETRVGF